MQISAFFAATGWFSAALSGGQRADFAEPRPHKIPHSPDWRLLPWFELAFQLFFSVTAGETAGYRSFVNKRTKPYAGGDARFSTVLRARRLPFSTA